VSVGQLRNSVEVELAEDGRGWVLVGEGGRADGPDPGGSGARDERGRCGGSDAVTLSGGRDGAADLDFSVARLTLEAAEPDNCAVGDIKDEVRAPRIMLLELLVLVFMEVLLLG